MAGNAIPINTTQGRLEYYNDDSMRMLGAGINHMEAPHGSIALLPGSGEVVMTMMDPTGNPSEAGVGFLDNTTGLQTDMFRIYLGQLANNGLFGKGIGLGDLELMCDLAPLEIGNYVWLDDDKDGIQDPCEEPIANVDVVLTASDGTTQTVTTDVNGEYYFPVDPNSAYTLTIDMTQSELLTYTATLPNVDAGTTITDGIDSDAILDGTLAVINLTTGNAGENDHTFDFGFIEEPRDYGDLLILTFLGLPGQC